MDPGSRPPLQGPIVSARARSSLPRRTLHRKPSSPVRGRNGGCGRHAPTDPQYAKWRQFLKVVAPESAPGAGTDLQGQVCVSPVRSRRRGGRRREAFTPLCVVGNGLGTTDRSDHSNRHRKVVLRMRLLSAEGVWGAATVHRPVSWRPAVVWSLPVFLRLPRLPPTSGTSDGATRRVSEGVGHLELLRAPAVTEYLCGWLSEDGPVPTPGVGP